MTQSAQARAQQPAVSAAQFSSDALGDIAASVNTFRGEVNLPLSLVKLPGPTGPGINVSAFYSSGVKQLVNTWNQSSPTDVLGLGWSIAEDRIIADVTDVASTREDSFYLLAGGSLPLYRVGAAQGTSQPAFRFLAKSQPFWQVLYYPSAGDPTKSRWEIVKEDGCTYVYAAGLEFRLAWNNWIGPTTAPPTNRIPVAWRLSAVRDPWGATIAYTYESDEVPLGSGGMTYTRAVRLKSITDTLGRVATFHYQPKTADEVQLPALAPSGLPQAFQFGYQGSYLDAITLANQAGQLLFTTHFDYQVANVSGRQATGYAKRYLTGVRQVYASGAAPAGYGFAYGDAQAVHPGALGAVTTPKGGVSSYEYAPVQLQQASTSALLNAPSPDDRPSIWHGPSYVVVAWYNTVSRTARFTVQSWSGSWFAWQASNDIGSFNLADLAIYPGQDFFAAVFNDTQQGRQRVFLFHANEYRTGEWLTPFEVQLPAAYTDLQVTAGLDYVAIASKAATAITIQQWDMAQQRWLTANIPAPTCTQVALAAYHDCILAARHDAGLGQVAVQLYHRNPDRTWATGDQRTTSAQVDWDVTTPASVWAIGPSFAAATLVTAASDTSLSYEVITLQWRTDFSFASFNTRTGQQAKQLSNPVGYSVATATMVGTGQHVSRLNGTQWIDRDLGIPNAGGAYRYAYGNDLMVVAQDAGGTVRYSAVQYDPYRMQWSPSTLSGYSPSANGGQQPTIAGGYCLIGQDLYYCGANLTWTKIYSLPDGTDLSSVQNRAPAYIAYQMRNTKQSYVLFLKDGVVWAGPEALPAGQQIAVPSPTAGQDLAGPGWFLAYTANGFASANQLHLYRVLEDTAQGVNALPLVSAQTIDSGFSTLSTTYTPDQVGASCDPSGTVAQFAKVRSSQGSGYTDTYYFNGMAPNAPGVQYPQNDAYTNVQTYFGAVNGQIYQTCAYDDAARLVARNTAYHQVYTQDPSGQLLFGAYVRLRKKTDEASVDLFQLDATLKPSLQAGQPATTVVQAFSAQGLTLGAGSSVAVLPNGAGWGLSDPASGKQYVIDPALAVGGYVASTIENQYNAKGQITLNLTHNVNSDGTPQVLARETGYAWEQAAYADMAARNLLSLVATSRQYNAGDGTTASMTAYTYRDWSGQGAWSKEKEYAWTGAGPATFDFSAWSGAGEPGGSWLKTRQTTRRNALGLDVEQLDVDGIPSTTLYDKTAGRIVAQFTSASLAGGEASYTGFEPRETPGPWLPAAAGTPLSDWLWTLEAHTGTRCLRLPAGGTLEGTFKPARGAQRFALSFWAKWDGPPGQASVQAAMTGTSGATATRTLAINATGTWSHVWWPLDPAAVGGQAFSQLAISIANAASAGLMIDNVFFAPLVDAAGAVVCDPVTELELARVTAVGTATRTAWDDEYRPALQVDPQGIPRSLVADYTWRDQGAGFDASTPNSRLGLQVLGDGCYDDFTHGNAWQARWSASGSWSATFGQLAHAGTTPGILTYQQPLPANGFGIRAKRTPGSPAAGNPFGLRVAGAVEARWSAGTWTLNDLATGQAVATWADPAGGANDWLMVVSGSQVMVWLDGRLCLQHGFASPIAGSLELFASDPMGFAFLSVFGEAIASHEYLDNAGNTIQSQLLGADGVHVGQTMFDDQARPAARTKITGVAGAGFGFRPGFASLDWASGLMSGEVALAHPEDQGYPYARQLLEASPLARLLEQGAPGKSNAILDGAGSHTTQLRYAALTHAANLLTDLPAGEYPMASSTNPDGQSQTSVVDRLGNVIALIKGNPADGPGNFTVERRWYDQAGRLVRLLLPNASDPAVSDAAAFAMTYSYDPQGRLVEITSPDADAPQRFAFDRAGRQRFAQDAAGAKAGYLHYWTYDALGRPLEEGTCSAAWDPNGFQPHVDDLAWLPAPGAWSHRNAYDGDGTDPLLIGKLTRVAVCTGDVPGREDVVTTYAYDINGRTIQQAVSYTSTGTSHVTRYAYDTAGNRTLVSYDGQDDGMRVAYAYDALGNMTSVDLLQGTGAAPVPVARYAYNPDRTIASESLYPTGGSPIVTAITYNSLGLPEDSSNAYFQETLSYSGGWQGQTSFAGRIAAVTTKFPSLANAANFVASNTYRFGYDDLGRLVSADSSASADASFGLSTPTTYDPNGNRLAIEVAGQPTAYGYAQGTDRLATAGQAGGFAYDGDGDLLAAPASGVVQLAYDPSTRLAKQVGFADGSSLGFEYDGAAQPVIRRRPGEVRTLVLDPAGRVLIEQVKQADGSLAESRFIYGPRGPIAVQSSGTLYALLADHTGSLRAVVAGGQVVSAYNYQAFGAPLGADWSAPGQAELTDRRFNGVPRDPATGLSLFPARLYDPRLGRFLQTDPASEFPSPYVFCDNDPVNRVDPTGRSSWGAFVSIFLGVAAVIAGAVITIATLGAGSAAGAAAVAGGTSLLTTAAVGAAAGALIGAGVSSAVYGATHRDDSTFGVGGYLAMVGMGAVFGAVTGGLGVLTQGASAGVSIAIDTALGGAQGLLSNGVSNSIEGKGFLDGAGMAIGVGLAMGFISGAIGRWTAVRNMRPLNEGDGENNVFLAIKPKGIGHSAIGANVNYEGIEFYHLVPTQGIRGKLELFNGGQTTTFGVARNARNYEDIYGFSLGRRAASKIESDIALQSGRHGSVGGYGVLSNSCTSRVVRSLQAGNHLAVPFWARTPRTLGWWASLTKAQYGAAIPEASALV